MKTQDQVKITQAIVAALKDQERGRLMQIRFDLLAIVTHIEAIMALLTPEDPKPPTLTEPDR